MNRRRILAGLGIILFVVLGAAGIFLAYLNSSAFHARARDYIVQEIEKRTGATVTLQRFNWNLLRRHFHIEDLTLHGLEPAGQAPLAHVESIDIGLNIRTLLEKHIDLFELTVNHPDFHILVSKDGKTNFPAPRSRPDEKPLGFTISIQNFNVVSGSALMNERQVDIDFSLRNLSALLNYHGSREVLESHLRYDGVLDRTDSEKPAIPYSLSADLDYTRATLIAQKVVVTSGANEIQLQGRVNQLLSHNISGKLDYKGNVQVPFLNYFFTKESFGGKAAVAGFLEFSPGYFFTQGNTISDEVDFEGWRASRFSGEYAYRYPDKRLSFRKMKSAIIGGSVSGNAVIDNLPGESRVNLDIDYDGVDAAQMARAYPWDPKYRVFSTMTGTLNGWFEGKLARFDFSGHAAFKSYTPGGTAGLIPLPLDGSTDYATQPGQARVSNADVRFYSTAVKAEGLIHRTMSDLVVHAVSSNLKDITFLYSDANGSGSFDGQLTGRIAAPVLNGSFTADNHVYRGQWKIQHATGTARLDTMLENAFLTNVRITQGESQILVNGPTTLSGTTSDLRIQSDHVNALDLKAFVNVNINGIFGGDMHVASLSPAIKAEGDVRADNFSIENHLVGTARGHVRYADPTVEIDQLSIRQNGATLTGSVGFNRSTDALKFTVRGNSVNLRLLDALGFPDSVEGVIRQADLRADGTITRPNLIGDATIENLSVRGESFSQAQVKLTSTGTRLDLTLTTARNIALTAQIDTAGAGYPFKAQATLTQYPIKDIGNISQIRASGNANLDGFLKDRTQLRGQGRIEADFKFQNTPLRTTKPFTFDLFPDRVTLSDMTLTGRATQVNVSGTVALLERAPLNLNITGEVDLALIPVEDAEWITDGKVNVVRMQVTGTPDLPQLNGQAHLLNATFGRRGLFNRLSNVNGDLFFNQDQVTVTNISGQMGGGTVSAQGTARLEKFAVQAMNIRIDAEKVRFRPEEGLRAVVDGSLVLQGAWESPLLQGRIQIENMAYRSNFEDFLALLRERSATGGSSSFSAMRLSLHVEGGRNITIQNQLADVEARVDLDVKGTVGDPSLTGHIEVSGGSLLFQGNRYSITRGTIDFVDPVRIDPVIDIEAESQVRDYRVILSITGRGNEPKLAMRSDPPLPELEIVSLIAGGRTREEIAARPGTATSLPTSEQLFQSAAGNILFDLLQERVGNRLGLLGGSKVHIDPFGIGAETGTRPRITVSQTVTKDLSITYSSDLSSNRQQVILIEYFVSQNTSILASRDELGNFGLDIKFRKRIK